jgi:hypothetical protein
MGDKTQLAADLDECRDVKRAKPGVTQGVVKAEIRNGKYDSLTPQIMEKMTDYSVTITPFDVNEGINYYIIIQ